MGLAISTLGMCQQQIRGRVLSPSKEPLVGATVQIEGTTTGTISDVAGQFELGPVYPASKIVVSYVGFISDTIVAQFDHAMSITLTEDVGRLGEVLIRGNTTMIDELKPMHSELITEKELTKAACCNLSESFETNASVDVSMADAVSGAKMIRMLGLDGRYVLISREGIPHIRGLSARYGLNYVPGTWIQSIDIGKGAGSVLNGYESMSGQINLELKKPEDSERWYLNAYANSFGRVELNANHSTALSDKWSTALLFHVNYQGTEIDGNGDGFMDMPRSRQINVLNRYKYIGKRLVSQIGVQYLYDDNAGGQKGFGFGDTPMTSDLYGFKNTSKRAELFGKFGLLFPQKPYKGWGLQYSLSYQSMDGGAGRRTYESEEKTAYANLIYQNIIGDTRHQYKAGISYLFDEFDELFVSRLGGGIDTLYQRSENVPGVFYEYNYLPNAHFTLVAGFRTDFHNLYGKYYTPRLHLRYALSHHLTMRASAGKGYRTPNVLMENSQVLVSSREFKILEKPQPEISWNYGGSLAGQFNVHNKHLNLTADYFYTTFENQLVYDQDISAGALYIYNLRGRSFAHSFQIEAQYELFKHLNVKTAYKYYNVQTTTNGQLQEIPFVNKDKFFVNLAYATRYEKWTADFTWVWNGPARLPDTSGNPQDLQLKPYSPSFSLVNTQISRGFRWGQVYLGGENIFNFKQKNPILAPEDPFGNHFDASMVWGPVAGRLIYAGIRYKIK